MNILHIITSPRSGSYSTQLGNHIVQELQKKHPNNRLVVRDLTKKDFPHIEEVHIHSFYTPAEHRSVAQNEALVPSDTIIEEVRQADIIVIGTPLYNLTIPSTLKVWIDHLVRAGETFRFTETGAEGLVHGKKVFVALSSGGIYSEGPMQDYDFAAPYLKAILGYIGIYDVSIVNGSSIIRRPCSRTCKVL